MLLRAPGVEPFEMSEPSPLKPSASLLIKLGSIIVHQEEMMSSKGHYFDKAALDNVRNDPEVVEWIKQMNTLAFLPVKR